MTEVSGAAPVRLLHIQDTLRAGLRFLGQAESVELAEAVRNWDVARIPASRTMPLP